MTNQQIKTFTLEFWQEMKKRAYMTAFDSHMASKNELAIRYLDLYKWIKQRIKNRE